MKIPAILNNDAVKTIGFFVCLTVPAALISEKCENHITDNIKSEVLSKDSLRYKRVEKETEKLGYATKKQIWIKELADMNDSIKFDSIAKKAYFEGAQMVRDSINNSKK